MLRQLTGFFLLCVMTTVLALEHPALKYCLCEEEFLLSECVCPAEEEVMSCDTCCGEKEIPVCKTHGETDDCIVSLEMDLGDFVHLGEVKTPERSDYELFVPVFKDVEVLSFSQLLAVELPEIRGSPDPPPPSLVPLYIRHSVYLI
jgi:hypothetical protein